MNSHLKRVLILLLIFTFVFQMAGVTSLSRVQAYADTETEEVLDVPDADEAEDVTTEEIDTESPGEIETDGENPPDAAEEPTDPETASEETAEVPEETPVEEETVTVEEPAEEPVEVEAEAAEAEAPMLKAATKAAKAEKTGTVLAFTSDAHNRSGNVVGTRIGTWIDNVESKHGDIDVMAFGGDMGVASMSSGSEYWTYAQADMTAVSNKGVTGVYTTGNHEYSMGGDFSYNSYTGNLYSSTETKGQFQINTEGAEGNNYRIYCLGSVSSSNSYSNQVSALEDYLNDVGNSKPIFIITHFPLHKYGSRKTTGAKSVIDVLNAAVGRGQTIVFLWGHNHTESDTYYDQIYGPGTVLPTNDGDQTIQFYYGAAGCMSDSENGTGSGYVKGKGLVVTIIPNRGNATMNFTYYNEAGTDVTETSSDSIRSVEINATSETIPVTNVTLDQATATVETGKTVKLTATVEPEDANSGLTWTSSNESIATVKNGTVTGVAEGTATITVASTEDSSIKDTCTVTVTATTEPIVGATVDITPASGSNSPEVTAKINVGETLVINAKNGSSSTSYEYTATLSDSNVAQIQGSSTVSIAASTTGQFTVEGLTEGTVDITIKNNQSSSSYVRKGVIHLTVGDGSTPVDPPAGDTVNITPTTDNPEESATIGVGDTLTINVTNGSTREAYDFTATLGNSGVAEIQGNATVNIAASRTGQFTVKGIANGTVDITIQNNNSTGSQYTRKGAIHLTVGSGGGNDPTPTEIRYVEATAFEANKDYIVAVDNGNGGVYALKNAGSGSLGSETLTVYPADASSAAYVKTTDTSLPWTYTITNSTGSSVPNRTRLSNSSRYLTINSSSKALETDTSGNYVVNLDGSKIVMNYNNGSSTSDSLYYIACNNGTFAATAKGDSASAATIKLYVKTEVPTDPVAVEGVSIDETASLEVGGTKTLTVTFTPENATNKAVTWSSSDANVATVDNGTVTAVAAGTATITVTTVDGGKTATCTVTVTEPDPGEGVTYYLADTLEADGEYIIANGNTGAVYVVSNTSTGSGTSTGLVGISANVVNDSITLSTSDAAKATFTAELKTSSSGAVSAWLKMGDNYLYTASSGGFRISNEQTSSGNTGKFWHYKADDKDLLWYFKDTSSSDGYTDTSSTYKYYLKCSSTGTFTISNVSSTSLANTDTPKIYLFKKATQKVDVTGVTLDKETLSLETGQTGTLTATVAPENATNKSVTWSTSDANVATVSNGTVTAVAAGTATITVTTVDGSKTATCTVTVTEPDPGEDIEYVPADTLVNGKDYLIANGNTGSVYVISNEANGSKTLKGIAANIADGKITISAANATKAAFTFESKTSDSGAISGWLKNGEKYLYTDSSDGLRMDTAQTTSSNSGKFWHYKGDGKNLLWYFKDTSSSDGYTDTSGNYRYYLEYDTSGNFTDNHVQNESLEATNTPAIYLFVRSDQAVPADSVTLDKTTASAVVGDTVTLKPTVTPEGATYRALTWTSSDPSVATVSGGTVTAIAAGTTTVTVTTASNKTATCTITVTAPAVERYVKVDSIKDGGEYIITNDATVGGSSTRALKNPGGSSSGVSISSSNGKTTVTILEGNIIETADTDIVWKATANGEGFNLENDGSYLEVQSRALKVYKPINQSSRYWTYSNNQLGHNGGSSVYYVTYGSGTFSAGTSAGNVYIFEKINGDTPHEHTYGTPAYAWADDNSTCTATVTCSGCTEGTEGHTVTETVTAAYAVTTAATCTAAGSGTYTATFTNELFAEQTKVVEIPLASHTLTHHAAVAPTCTADGTVEYWSCSVCEKNFIDEAGTTELTSIVAPATGHDMTHHDAVAPTCTEDGTVEYWACSKCNKNFGDEAGTTELESIVDPATGHAYGAPQYEWAADNSTVTASRVCANNSSHVDTQTVTTTYAVTTPATCEAAGVGTYTATFTNNAFATQTKTVAIEALGHDWEFVNFTWTGNDTDGYTAAVANYKCKNDAAHTQTVAATVTPATTAATCEEAGSTVYTATVAEGASLDGVAHSDTKTVAIEALGHDWEFVNFTWNGNDIDGYTAAVANYKCKRNEAHTQTVNATVTPVTTAATCDDAGQTVYTAEVAVADSLDGTAHNDTKTVAIAALGHKWGTPVWTWTANEAEEYTAAKATFTCENNSEHFREVEDTELDVVTVPATPTEAGSITYTATVTGPDNKSYSDQKVKTLTPTGYSFKDPVYSWTEVTGGGYSCTALKECNEDPAHNISETVTATYAVTTPATCETAGAGTYTATFTNTAFETQTKPVEIDALGHKLTAHAATLPTCTEAGNSAYWSCDRCDKFFSDEEGNTEIAENSWVIEATGHDLTAHAAVAATCETAGNSAYWTCDTCGKYFSDAEGKTATTAEAVVIAALGHDWNTPTYAWAADHTSVTATRTCKNNASHTETETVAATSAVTTPATCTEPGVKTWTSAAFSNTAFTAQTTTEAIPATGHVWIEPAEWTWIGDEENGYTKVEGTFTCQNDSTHTQTVESTNITVRTVDPTPTQSGKTTYTAKVTGPDNVVYSIQKEIVIPPAGYTYKDPVYDWTETADGYSVTALKECNEDHAQDITETVNASYAVTTAATCLADGVGTYTASFTNSAFATQTKTEDIPATGHTPVTDAAVAPTCTETGLTEGSHCSVCNKVLVAQETVPALGHDWNDPTDEWNNDHTSVDMTFTCKNDPTHIHTETVNGSAITSEITTQPTATAPGVRTYTATVTLDGKTYTVTDTEAIPATGTVSGNITSYVGRTEEGQVTVQLFAGDSTEPAYTATVTNNETYSFAGVAAGTYTMKVSKKDHVTRSYEITTDGTALTQDVKIHLLGDVNGDGKVNTRDVGMVNQHVREVSFIDGYEFACADVVNDGKLNTRDVGKINSHVRETKFLW